MLWLDNTNDKNGSDQDECEMRVMGWQDHINLPTICLAEADFSSLCLDLPSLVAIPSISPYTIQSA